MCPRGSCCTFYRGCSCRALRGAGVKRCRGVGLLCGPRAESLPSLIGEECPALPWLPCPVLLPWRASEAALVLFWERQKSPAGRWNQP